MSPYDVLRLPDKEFLKWVFENKHRTDIHMDVRNRLYKLYAAASHIRATKPNGRIAPAVLQKLPTKDSQAFIEHIIASAVIKELTK